MMQRERSVIGMQWYVTLPKEWRGSHNIEKGDKLNALFNPKSVLIFNPKNREMSPIERTLVEILTELPVLEGTKELIGNLRTLVEQLETV